MHRIGPKGTVVIEKEIRERLGLTPGVEVDQRVVGQQVLLTFYKPQPPGSAFGILAPAIQGLDPAQRERLATNEGLDDAIDEAWGAYAQERYGETSREGSGESG